MPTPLEEYQQFIDALVRQAPDVTAKAISDGGWHRWATGRPHSSVDYVQMHQILASLNDEQRKIITDFIQQARVGGIHDVLAYLTDEIHCRGLSISRNGQPLAVEPYGSEMYYDFICRLNSDKWPEELVQE